MSITDILTSDMIKGVTAVSIPDMLLAVGLSFVLGLFIFFVYKKTYNGIMYSSNFGMSLIAMSMISAVLILAVSSNIVLSLGMVGALSIVRFRAAIKEPMDIVFLFWSIAVGIIVATGMIPLAVLGSAGIGVVLLIFANRRLGTNPYLLVIHADSSDREEAILQVLSEAKVKRRIKGKSIQSDGRFEMTVEVQLAGEESSFVQKISALEGIADAVLVSFNGDYMS